MSRLVADLYLELSLGFASLLFEYKQLVSRWSAGFECWILDIQFLGDEETFSDRF